MDHSTYRRSSSTQEVSPPVEWGTIQEAAALRFVSVQTMRRYITQGLVQAERFGPRLIRVNLTSLNSAGRPLASDAL
ncbi:DNA-binding protein [Cryobacterium tagatosivorans]|uniref:DNA-binding protein n=1 Tax=Cryobacterium tagatosivorans TaxID=1259199 RepID=A0A4R8UAX3_9MICO|nr:DNA-binding protein [Cryobacterium tagatosivorans]TFB46511.1 DNA-binding protein [Cryobacterium tagatosivorans]